MEEYKSKCKLRLNIELDKRRYKQMFSGRKKCKFLLPYASFLLKFAVNLQMPMQVLDLALHTELE